MSTTADNRCGWYAGNKRCRYIGTMSGIIATDKSYPELACTAHFQCVDGDLGSRIVEDSHREVPADFDYSTAAILARVRKLHFGSPRAPPSPQLTLEPPIAVDPERAAIEGETPTCAE